MHYNLRPASVLLDENREAVIGDFRLARPVGSVKVVASDAEREDPQHYDVEYTSPELAMGTAMFGEVDKKSDVYSFALTLLEVLSRKALWLNEAGAATAPSEIREMVIVGERPRIEPRLREEHPRLVEIIEKAWDSMPAKRPTFSDIKAILSAHQA